MKKIPLLLLSLLSLTLFAQPKTDSLRITLAKAIEIALNENPSMRIADRTIETKKYYKKEQIVSLFPSVAAGASYQRTLQKQKMVMDMSKMTSSITDLLNPIVNALIDNNIYPVFPEPEEGDGAMEIGSYNNMVLSANFTLPIIMPALWNSLKLNSMDIELAVEQSRASKMTLINNVKKAYYQILLLQETYNVLMGNYKRAEQNAKLAGDKYNQGLVSEFEKLRAELQVDNLKPNITQILNFLELSKKALKIQMGVDINEYMVFDGELKDFEAEMEAAKVPSQSSLSLDGNTDLKQLDMAIQQLERSKKIVLSGACPSLVFTGSFQYMTMGDDIPFNDFKWFPTSYIALGLQVPITSWASTTYKTKQIKNNILNMNDTRLNVERALWLSVASHLGNIDKAIADFESSSASVKIATRACNIARKQYEVGLATWLQLYDVELALLNTQQMYYQSIHDYLVAQAELEHLLGKEN
ncbi:MAG: TolC family protein [Lentimicrobiaceae bacterium]|nr:TolC family protein [Lentimicrobiaceae bacterium]